MTRDAIDHLLRIAASHGLDAAREAHEEALHAELMAEYDCDDRRIGPTDDDTVDIHGGRLRPRVNDAGEPYWM